MTDSSRVKKVSMQPKIPKANYACLPPLSWSVMTRETPSNRGLTRSDEGIRGPVQKGVCKCVQKKQIPCSHGVSDGSVYSDAGGSS